MQAAVKESFFLPTERRKTRHLDGTKCSILGRATFATKSGRVSRNEVRTTVTLQQRKVSIYIYIYSIGSAEKILEKNSESIGSIVGHALRNLHDRPADSFSKETINVSLCPPSVTPRCNETLNNRLFQPDNTQR